LAENSTLNGFESSQRATTVPMSPGLSGPFSASEQDAKWGDSWTLQPTASDSCSGAAIEEECDDVGSGATLLGRVHELLRRVEPQPVVWETLACADANSQNKTQNKKKRSHEKEQQKKNTVTSNSRA
jgi:hypothetical protein